MSMPIDPLFIDLETQSAVGIKNIHEYVHHPSTRILCATAKWDGQIHVWIPPGRAPKHFNQLKSNVKLWETLTTPFPNNRTWIAHNAYGFDALVWNRLYPNHIPNSWIDTIPICRSQGLPAALDNVSSILFGERKTPEGKAIIQLLCEATYRGSTNYSYPIGTPALWEKLIEYNVQDVNLLEKLYNRLAPQFKEWELLALDWQINQRGIRFDVELVKLILDLWNEVQSDAFDYVGRITEGELTSTDLRSTYKVNAWLKKQGVQLDSLNKHTLMEELAEYDTESIPRLDTILLVLEARQTVTRSSRGKVERLLEMYAASGNSRLANSLNFHGAHTGRWSGKGIQPHNLARPVDAKRLQDTLEIYESNGTLTIDDLGDKPADRLTELMRPIFCASPGNVLLIGDYAQIEARCTAWLAEDTDRLQLFNDPKRDLYCETASTFYGETVTKSDPRRQVGKVAELALQYGMSGSKLKVFALRSKPSVDLQSMGLDPIELVKKWREKNKAIVNLWKRCEQACKDAVLNDKAQLGSNLCAFKESGNLYIELPSGRNLVYRHARVEMRVPKYVHVLGLPEFKRPTIIYDHPHGREGTLYGGLIVENIVQATCRDIMADALLRCSDRGLNVVLHVHDEIVCEQQFHHEHDSRGRAFAGDKVLCKVMNQLPEWAEGFPMKVDVATSKRYCK